MFKKSFLALFVFLIAVSFAVVFKTQAGVGNNTSGWSWGGSDDGGGNSTGLGWVSFNNTNTGGSTDYGLDIPVADGNFAGPGWYAWSSNVGWIDFAPAGPYPAGVCGSEPCPTTGAVRIGEELSGWARIIGIRDAAAVGNSGGWEGWIKLRGKAQDDSRYGVSLDPTISGFAWSNELGWIDFSRATTVATPPKTLTTSLTAVPGGCIGCSSLPVTLTGTRTGGTATGNITYEFDCTNDGTYEYTVTTPAISQDYLCTYSSTATARVRLTQEGVFSESTTTIAILAAVCGNGAIEGTETCDDGPGNNGPCPLTCDSICHTQTCPVNSGNWIEVAP